MIMIVLENSASFLAKRKQNNPDKIAIKLLNKRSFKKHGEDFLLDKRLLSKPVLCFTETEQMILL